MSSARVRFSLFRAGDQAGVEGVAMRDVQEFWFTLARFRWSSLVLVPADEGISAAPLANALADVGCRLRDSPVTAIVADSMDYESARILADLQLRVQVDRRTAEAVQVVDPIVTPPSSSDPGSGGAASDGEAPAAAEAGGARETALMAPAGQVVVAIQPVVVEPLGVAIAQAADAVILCLELGKTRIDAARRTMELIGPDRIAGAFLL